MTLWEYEFSTIKRAFQETEKKKFLGGGFVVGVLAYGGQMAAGLHTPHDTLLFILIAFGSALIGVFSGFLIQLFTLPAKMASEQQEKHGSAVKACEELQKQDQQFALQQKAIDLQSFENSFFQHLELFKSVRYETTVKYEQFMAGMAVYQGLEGFAAAKNLFKTIWGNRKVDTSNMLAVEAGAKTFYLNFYEVNREGLAHYFRTLYQIIIFIDASSALDSEKAKRH